MSNSPYVATTTPAIERANRLLSVRAHPGFLDIIRLSEEIIEETINVCQEYAGWDKDVMALLFARMQAAKGHHRRLLTKINEAIADGEAEVKTLNTPAKSAEDIIEQGDLVRQEVLTKFSEMDAEARPAGSY